MLTIAHTTARPMKAPASRIARRASFLVLISLAVSGCGGRAVAGNPTALGASPTLPPPRTPVVPATATAPPVVQSTTVLALSTIAPTMAPPTATPEGRLGPDDLPDDVNRLTGEVAVEAALLDHRPLAIKIVNEPSCARPQYGLNQAALVFEHYVEAWGTRLTAVFYGYKATKIGAVRSARLIDLELPAIFDAILVTSGSSAGVKQLLLGSDFAARIIASELHATCPPLCRVPVETVSCADLEHSLFTDLRDLHAQASKSGLDTRPASAGWAFSDTPLSSGPPASALHVDYLNSPVDWAYDTESGNYLRSQDGVRHVDAETRMRLTARNVVVLFAHHLFSDIRESSNFYSLEIQFWGQGRALLFRDGQAFEGLWLRPTRPGLFQLVDSQGAPMPLKPGRTWFEFVALDSVVQAAEGIWTITATVLPEQTPPRPY